MRTMSTSSAKHTPESLRKLSDEEFRTLVDDDTRARGTQDLADALRSRGVAVRWHDMLLSMLGSVEGQLAARQAEMSSNIAYLRAQGKFKDADRARAEGEKWRASAIRFKTGLEEKLRESTRVLRAYGVTEIDERIAEERNQALARVAILEAAIRSHRDSFPLEDDDPTEDDEELWSHVPRQR